MFYASKPHSLALLERVPKADTGVNEGVNEGACLKTYKYGVIAREQQLADEAIQFLT